MGTPPRHPEKHMLFHKTEKGLPRISEIFPLKMGLFPLKACVSKGISFRYLERTILLEHSSSQQYYFNQA